MQLSQQSHKWQIDTTRVGLTVLYPIKKGWRHFCCTLDNYMYGLIIRSYFIFFSDRNVTEKISNEIEWFLFSHLTKAAGDFAPPNSIVYNYWHCCLDDSYSFKLLYYIESCIKSSAQIEEQRIAMSMLWVCVCLSVCESWNHVFNLQIFCACYWSFSGGDAIEFPLVGPMV